MCHIYCQKDHWHPLSTRVVDHGLPGIVSSLQQTVIDSDLCRLVRHKNLVQFIGACSCWPKLCIVTELMASGRYALKLLVLDACSDFTKVLGPFRLTNAAIPLDVTALLPAEIQLYDCV